jgi:hypothetical protein
VRLGPRIKGITAVIDFIILAVNLVNLASASLYFRRRRGLQARKNRFCAYCRQNAVVGDGKRYIVQSDELLTAFLELEATLL